MAEIKEFTLLKSGGTFLNVILSLYRVIYK